MIDTRTAQNTLIIDLPDVVEGEQLQATIQSALQAPCTHVAINMINITFIESSGLGALVSGYKQCDAGGKKMVFFGIQPYVEQLLELTKLNRVLTVFANEQTALNSALS